MRGKKKTAKKVEKVSKADSVKPFDYKTWIWVLLAVAALILVIIAIVNFSQNEKFDSSYFHDADGKIVLTMTGETSALDNSEYESDIVHVVYFYDGEKITRGRIFYEYETDAEAEEAYKHLDLSEYATNGKISGRFVVFDINNSLYKDVTVTQLKEDVESLKQADALILDYDQQSDETE